MISSILVTGPYKIGQNANKKIKVNDTILSVEKEIPFVRYRFSTYSDSDFEYIKSMTEQFPVSTHLVELTLDENTVGNVRKARKAGSLAVFVYADVTEDEVQGGSLSATTLENVAKLKELSKDETIDRFMLKDKSKNLDRVTIHRFIKQLKDASGFKDPTFGVCGSPYSFDDMCCLTAVRARELMAKYSSVPDVALPSANHQNMNTCGCIRYITVNNDLAAPLDAKTGKKKVKVEGAEGEATVETTESKPKAKPVPKNVIKPGMFRL